MPSDPPEVSIVVVPRERKSVALGSMRSLERNTGRPHELIYVDCVLPRGERERVRGLVEEHGGRFIRSDDYLYPNQARNIGIEHARGEFVVFVDNDLFVEPGWLDSLVECARETDAGVVGPLYLEGPPQEPLIHGAGGRIRTVEAGDGGPPRLIARQNDLGVPLHEAGDLRRTETDLVEFHCTLVSRACLDAIGGRLDEGLRTSHEHVDLCMMAREAGYAVYFEPRSRVRYGNVEPVGLSDLPYFLYRWSGRATRRTLAHFEDKWDVTIHDRHRRFARTRRLRAVGMALWPLPTSWFLGLWSAGRRLASSFRSTPEGV